MAQIKASDYIINWIRSKGVKTIFGYQGGMITHLVDSISKVPDMRFVQTYHEQSAAFAAVGYARNNCTLGVAMATSGPGATNLMTGIADAYFDSVPVIFITGQVNSYEYKYDKPIRQQGFQEANIVEMVKPITKYAVMIDDVTKLADELEHAFIIATSGRKGPVVLDITMNVQRELLDVKQNNLNSNVTVAENDNDKEYSELLEAFKKAKRPLVLVGGGIASCGASDLLGQFLEISQIPYLSSLQGKASCNEYDDNYIGTIGSYGNRCANMAVANADLLLVLGSRLDVRQTGGIVDSFAAQAKIFHIDIDEHELTHSRIKNKNNINVDLKEFLNNIISFLTPSKYPEWSAYLNKLKSKYDQKHEIDRTQTKTAPYELMSYLNAISTEYDAFCADVGQNQMWAMQMLKLGANQKFYTSGGFGAMGSALPIAVGIAFADLDNGTNSTIFVITGDGGIHMSLQSLMLIKQYDLPIKVIIVNNRTLGMITQFQELYFNNNMVGTAQSGGYLVPEFKYLAAAYGLRYLTVEQTNKRQFNSAEFHEFAECRNCLLEYIIDSDCRVYPKLEYNQPIYNPSPVLNSDELADSMLIQCIEG